MNSKVFFEDLGLIDYKKAWDYQETIFSEILLQKSKNRKENLNLPTDNYLFFCEHYHVYTLGKSGDEQNLLVNESYLKSRGASFYKINRGGDITYHGPGQIVGYPVIDLENFFTDINKYLRSIEEVVILTLKEWGVQSERSKGETGVWIDAGKTTARKICAIGVRTSRWVTMHGFALNVNTDLSYFQNIVPCGIDKSVTSLQKELGREVDFKQVQKSLKNNFRSVFNVQLDG